MSDMPAAARAVSGGAEADVEEVQQYQVGVCCADYLVGHPSACLDHGGMNRSRHCCDPCHSLYWQALTEMESIKQKLSMLPASSETSSAPSSGAGGNRAQKHQKSSHLYCHSYANVLRPMIGMHYVGMSTSDGAPQRKRRRNIDITPAWMTNAGSINVTSPSTTADQPESPPSDTVPKPAANDHQPKEEDSHSSFADSTRPSSPTDKIAAGPKPPVSDPLPSPTSSAARTEEPTVVQGPRPPSRSQESYSTKVGPSRARVAKAKPAVATVAGPARPPTVTKKVLDAKTLLQVTFCAAVPVVAILWQISSLIAL